MYLKNLKLAGFKSFVDPTLIPIRGRLNAVVGPNGCGKSNIVDAIRWVIGESSAKQLRGQSMSDVIFNGTTKRQPVGRAMVELRFDNAQGKITGEYAKYNEIAVRREVERDGQSDYFINGTRCRRRDVLDLFLGTGLGPRSYAIIEQGMISQLVEAKPEEVRTHIEEVAGISKYKERRRETENRIRHTQDNLDRLSDLREELAKQLRHLKRQANAAENYKVYKQDERLLQAQLKALQWQALAKQATSQEQTITESELEQEKKRAEQRHVEADIEKSLVLQSDLNEKHAAIQKSFYELGATIARLEQKIKNDKEQQHHWQQELAQSETLWEELNNNITEHQQQIEELESDLSELNPQSGNFAQLAAKAQATLKLAETAMADWQTRWESFQESAATTSRDAEVTKTNISHYEKQTAQLAARCEEYQRQLQAINIDALHREIDPLVNESKDLQEKINTEREQATALSEKINAQRDINHNNDKAIESLQVEWQTLQARYASLEELQQAALGKHDEQSQQWLEQQQIAQRQRLAQSITVDGGWETAVETVLGGYFDSVCVDDIHHYLAKLPTLSEGHLMLVDSTDSGEGGKGHDAKKLIAHVQSKLPLHQWLQGIYVADDLQQAKQLLSSLSAYESVVTRDGTWLAKNWVRVSKQKDQQSSILWRQQQLQLLQKQIADLASQIETAKTTQQDGRDLLNELEQKRDELHSHVQELTQSLSRVNAEVSGKKARLEDSQQRQQQLMTANQEAENQIGQLNNELNSTKERLLQLQINQQQCDQQRDQLLVSKTECQEQLEEKRRVAQQYQQQADEFEIRLSANESQLALLRQTIERDERQLEKLTDRRQLLSSQLENCREPLQQQETELQNELQQRLTIEENLHAAARSLRECSDEIKALESKKSAFSEAIDSLQSQLEKLRVDKQTIVVRQTTIVEQLSEKEIELQSVIDELPEEVDQQIWQERLEKLQARIQRLGPINLAAIDEFNSGSERKEYLDKQNDDLVAALDVLQTAIRKIDKETKVRFRETFDKVNQKFQELFPRIFSGGRGTLELTDDDLLATGILIKAQPPGKRNATIHMLSGGEKALTAVSLVFAMFSLNPAPFCILDEVDAPLDDLNVGRFCQLVKEMSKETQFIVVSHNKVTIEMADHLMGVTMQELGVSRLVAVDMAEALDMVEA